MTGWIDLNADLGEGMDHDAEIMAVVTSCNIACGGHAGDTNTMQVALTFAKAQRVAAGAHPSYPDREGFGRRKVDISIPDLKAALTSQIEALTTHADQIGIPITHLKPHGALYNEAASDLRLANLIAELTGTLLPRPRLFGPPGSALETAAFDRNIPYLSEGFADRAYTEDGHLVPRDRPGAVLETGAARIAQALSIATTQTVTSIDGKQIPLPVQTLCLHGDSPGALSSARAIRAALEVAGINVRAPQ